MVLPQAPAPNMTKETSTDRRNIIVRTVNNVSLTTRVAEAAANSPTEGTMGILTKTIYRHKVGIQMFLDKEIQCRCPLPNKTTQEINHSQICLNLFLGKILELRCHKHLTPSFSQLTSLPLNSTA